ncbi:hypothetical protein JYU34_008672 [Plutella xylostella]|uniref:Uncharacterized protein n=1 Tax=Plutella xylostella TaxID=51655 RepID=A0ABQ7QLH3_PLUXY|nr:hypothetical protein JYU34_008672 [Plutella xylostella]
MGGSEVARENSRKNKYSFSSLFKPSNKNATSLLNDETRTNGTKKVYKGILGKCKPGGCLDPPFNEDSYPYSKKEENSAYYVGKNKTMIEEKLPASDGISNKDHVDHNSKASSIDRNSNKLETFKGSKKTHVDEVFSNNLITYPPTSLTSSENEFSNKAIKYIKRPDKLMLAHHESGENYFPSRNGNGENSDEYKPLAQDSFIDKNQFSKNETTNKPSSRDSNENTIEIQTQKPDVNKLLHDIPLENNDSSAAKDSIINLKPAIIYPSLKSESKNSKIINDIAFIDLHDDRQQKNTETTESTHNSLTVSENINKDNSMNSHMHDEHIGISNEDTQNYHNNSKTLYQNPDDIDNTADKRTQNEYEGPLELDKVFDESPVEDSNHILDEKTNEQENNTKFTNHGNNTINKYEGPLELDKVFDESPVEDSIEKNKIDDNTRFTKKESNTMTSDNNSNKGSSSENSFVTDINNGIGDDINNMNTINSKPVVDAYDINVTSGLSREREIMKTESPNQKHAPKYSSSKLLNNDDNERTPSLPDIKILSVDKFNEDNNLPIADLYQEKDNISNKFVVVDIRFQRYRDSQNQLIFKSVDTKKDFVRFKDDIITTINAKVQANTTMQIPIDEDSDIFLNIAMKGKSLKNAKEGSSLTLSTRNTENALKRDLAESEASDFPHGTRLTSAKLNKTLSLVYEDQLLPLQNIIMSLKNEIDAMAQQQALFKQTIISCKRRSYRVRHVKKCNCSRRSHVFSIDKIK